MSHFEKMIFFLLLPVNFSITSFWVSFSRVLLPLPSLVQGVLFVHQSCKTAVSSVKIVLEPIFARVFFSSMLE